MLRGVCLFAGLSLGLASSVSAYSPVVELMSKQAARLDDRLDEGQYTAGTHMNWTASGVNEFNSVGAGSWTCGFFPGLLWQLYIVTGVETWKTRAVAATEGIRDQQHNTDTHDVGFMVMDTFALGYIYGAMGDDYRSVVLNTATSLATRFSPTVGCIMSWNPGHRCREDPDVYTHFPVIIDNMMNLELLLWASENGGNSSFKELAISHADKTAKNHVRADGSTFHVVNYDPDTGKVANQCTAQGYTDKSTWSRGQAWCVYGFSMVYRYTGLTRMLDTAQRCANVFLANLPEDNVPVWDFAWDGSTDITHRDSSAGAVAASGLLDISLALQPTDPAAAKVYEEGARNILAGLVSSDYIGDYDTTEGTLMHSVGNYMRDSQVDVTLSYGDYYLLEALRKANLTLV